MNRPPDSTAPLGLRTGTILVVDSRDLSAASFLFGEAAAMVTDTLRAGTTGTIVISGLEATTITVSRPPEPLELMQKIRAEPLFFPEKPRRTKAQWRRDMKGRK